MTEKIKERATSLDGSSSGLFGLKRLGVRAVAIALGCFALTPKLQAAGPITFPISTALSQVAWGSGIFVAVGVGGTIITSSDAVDWFAQPYVTGENLFAVHYANSTFVAAGGFSGTVLTSTNGYNWADYEVGGSDRLFGVTHGAGTWVVVGDYAILTSTDGVNWTPNASAVVSSELWSVAYGGGVFIAVGVDGIVLRSTDALTWYDVSFTSDWLLGVQFIGGQFVAVGQAGLVYTSPDGLTWNSHPTTAWCAPGLNVVANGNGRSVAVGFDGSVLTSPDSAVWTRQAPGIESSLYGVCFGNGMFVAVGGGYSGSSDLGTLITSVDGEHWRVLSARPLSVAIHADSTNAPVAGTVNFTGQTPGSPTSSWWDFGDGTVVSNTTSVTHTWAAPGTYPVVFTAYDVAHHYGVSSFVIVQVGAPVLVARATNGVPRFFLQAQPGFPFVIQTSTDLATWSPIGIVIVTNIGGLAPIIDTNVAAPKRFYRAVSQ